MAEYIEREAAIAAIKVRMNEYIKKSERKVQTGYLIDPTFQNAALGCRAAMQNIEEVPAADVVPVPKGGIGKMSDGYHTFDGLYYQRMVLFAALVKVFKDKAWKSWKHEDGELCFGGGWFIVGIDTPQGSYTYHYEDKYWNWFECEELPVGKHWDGHTEDDVTRLLSLDVVSVRHGRWIDNKVAFYLGCSECGCYLEYAVDTFLDNGDHYHYCPNCGARMDGDGE